MPGSFPPITICKAGENEIPLIQQIAEQTWPVAYGGILSPEQLAYMLERIYSLAPLTEQIRGGLHQFVIAYEGGGRAVAFADYGNILPNTYKLHKIYALPDQQGKGLGKMLVAYVSEEIKKLGATHLRLNVNRHNPAKQFYEHLGFSVLYEADIDIGNGFFMNDYIMEKKV